jgi:uncharacterized protein (TIGR03435 family)
MIGFAYKTDRIDGLPQWALDARYDVTATVAEEDLCLWCQMQHRGKSDDAVRDMYKGLLKERFLLEWHTESRPVSGYALVLAKGGPKLKPVQPPTGLQPHGFYFAGTDPFGTLTMAEFAERLSTAVGHPVADKTGLTGYYRVTLSHAYTDRRMARRCRIFLHPSSMNFQDSLDSSSNPESRSRSRSWSSTASDPRPKIDAAAYASSGVVMSTEKSA